MKNFVAVGVVVAIAGQAIGQYNPQPGDIVFTSQQSNAIKVISGTTPSSPTTLVSYAVAGSQLGPLTQGPDGNFYVSDGRFPVDNPSTAGVLKTTNLFGVAPSIAPWAQGDPLQQPLGIRYSANTNAFLVVNNPFGPITQPAVEGILSVSYSNPASVSIVHAEPPTNSPRPRYQAGIFIEPDPNSNDFFVMTVNGGGSGSNNPPDDLFPSAMWRLRYNAGSYALDTAPVVDFSASFTGLPFDLTQARGIAPIPGTNDIFVSDHMGGNIFKVSLTGAGTFAGITLVLGGLNQPEALAYNPYTNKLVIDERGNLTASRISTMNLDGTGFTVLSTGDHARGFVIVPAPGAAALLGIGGLLATRRRR